VRIEQVSEHQIVYRLPQAQRDGLAALSLSPLEPRASVAALMPPPHRHLYRGVPRPLPVVATPPVPSPIRRVRPPRRPLLARPLSRARGLLLAMPFARPLEPFPRVRPDGARRSANRAYGVRPNPSLSALPNLPRIFNELEFFRGRAGHYI
jgi:hypothetical protein